MIAKTFEVRDSGTFIPVLAIQLAPDCEADRYLFARAGYGTNPTQQGAYVVLTRLAGGSGFATCDPYDWTNARTLQIAHNFIRENFSMLRSGSVVDVEYLMGETKQPKESEANTTNSYTSVQGAL